MQDPRPPKRKKDPALLRQMHLEGGECVVCGATWGLTLHHKIRRGQPGGDDARENLVFLCMGPGTNDCHGRLHSGLLSLTE